MIVYKDGAWQGLEETSIPVMDHGFLYGVGLFETFRTYQGSPFLFQDHLKRLREGLASVYIEWEEDDDSLLQMIGTALEKNNLTDGVLRLNVTAGISNWGLPNETYTRPSTLLFTRPVAPVQDEGRRAIFLQIPRNTPEGSVRLKSHHYLNNLLGKRELGNLADTEGIFLTREGYVSEGIVSNIFWVKNSTLYTPSISTGILNGVTRQYVIHLARLLGVKVEEGTFTKDELLHSEEVFVTNSTQEMVRINQVDEVEFPKAGWHSLFERLRELYKESTYRQLQSYQQAKRVDIQNGKDKLISE
ncbi:4-amino-4-deoxychorismate lyase [Bacillus tianshenii]|uniref:aminodeoxychorismate lyase n=1 Tax=Sutcliffiella tianshenii TaxID=1463404 RepID=A0ABS2P5S4_9BACI|nr:aminodeoxychorismate lyase [Bacillus tianshenii]MBM7622316.1 4-amino-4-deoxychorismate lyase [Bacillus tianshenii]